MNGRRIQKTDIAPLPILIDFIGDLEMGRVAPHSFSILRTQMRDSVRKCAVVIGKTHPIEYMEISEKSAPVLQIWHGLCYG